LKDDSIVLSVQNIKKKIKNKLIIKGISFDVRAGEVFGFLGPNGSGKTTTIRMLVDLIKPTEGSIYICGIPVSKKPDEALQHVGCIVENPELYAYLSGWENLEHFARMLPDVTEERIHEVVEIVGMDQRIQDKVKTYSLGMRQRLGIAQALLGKPKLLILDEPTNGLDPQGIKEMRIFIRNLAKNGLSVFVSSHLLSEIQLMCDRVAIISHGNVIAVGNVGDLIRQNRTTVEWRFSPLEKGLKLLETSDEVTIITEEPKTEQAEISLSEIIANQTVHKIVCEMPAEQIPILNAKLVQQQVNIYSITIKNPTLEDLFLRLTDGEKID
jgi:ABC-2 type transport system ATP-binding protein